eukprot:gene9055-9993_t
MLVVVLVVALAIGYFVLIHKSKRPAGAPPIAHVGLPIVGNYLAFASNPVDFIQTCLDKFGTIYTVTMLGKHLTFLLGPEACAPFYQLSDEKMSQAEVYSFMTPIFGKGVVYDAEPRKRQQQMQAMAGALKSNRLKDYIGKIERETLEYTKKWGESGEVDLLEAMSELTILTSSRCLHGDDVRENLFEDVARIYRDLDKGVTALSFFFPYAPTPAHKKRDDARAEMVRIFSKIIQQRRASGATADTRTDILQVYIDFKYKEDGTGLSDDQIVGLLIALLFAGQHTSTITSTWTTMLLLHNPECMAKVLEEQEKILKDGRSFDFDAVSEMEYLTNCTKETLRLFPPLVMLMRQALDDIEVTSNGKKFVIPKGDMVFSSPAVQSRMESVFKNADKFEPDRFGPERNEHKVPFAYLGFGAGRHACLGQQFGILQVKTLMSVLLRNFKFEAVDKELPEQDFQAMVVGPKNHTKVRYQRLPTSALNK